MTELRSSGSQVRVLPGAPTRRSTTTTSENVGTKQFRLDTYSTQTGRRRRARSARLHRLADTALLAVLFPPLYLAAWWMDRSDKRQAHGRWTR